MAKFKDKDEFLDKLYDHVFPESEGDPSEEDIAWFEHLSSFFSDDGGNANDNNNPPAPRRRRASGSSTSGTPRRRSRQSASSGYGNSAWFGS